MKAAQNSIFQTTGMLIILTSWVVLIFFFQMLDIQRLELDWMVLIHVSFSLALILGTQIFLASTDKILFWSNVFLHLGFPFLGPCFSGCLVLALACSPRMELLSDFHEEDASLTIKKHNAEPKSFGDSLRHSLNVEPLVETIRSDQGTDLKRGAIEMLTRIANPHSVSLLKECLSDSNSEVRFYASSGLARIEEGLNHHIIKYKNRLKEMAEPTGNDYYQLAKAYYEFVYLAIQDEASLQYYLKQSIINFEKAYGCSPFESKILNALERAYTRAGLYAEARKLKESMEGDGDQDLMYTAESWFKERQFFKCKEVLLQMAEQSEQPNSTDPIGSVLGLWRLDKRKCGGTNFDS
jgi:hypothetical protein